MSMTTILFLPDAEANRQIDLILAEADDINSEVNVFETGNRMGVSFVAIGLTRFLAALDERRASIKEGTRQ